MTPYLLASMLVLQPIVDAATHVRLVSVGTEGHEVVWYLDGFEAARTRDGDPARVPLPAGRHELHAVTEHRGEWQVMARPEPDGSEATYVPAWTARHVDQDPPPPPAASTVPAWAFPVALALGGAAVVLWPERRIRTKGP